MPLIVDRIERTILLVSKPSSLGGRPLPM